MTNQNSTEHGSDLGLYDSWLALKEGRKLWFYLVCLITMVAGAISVSIPPVYRAQSGILPIAPGRGFGEVATPAVGGLNLLGLSSALGSLGGSGTASKFLAILKSRSAARQAVIENGLMRMFFKPKWDSERHEWKSKDMAPEIEDGVDLLLRRVSVEPDPKSGTIVISAFMEDPQTALDIVESYLSFLKTTLDTKAFTIAHKQRVFLGSLLLQNQQEYLEAASAVSDFYRRFRIAENTSLLDVKLKIEDPSPIILDDLVLKKEKAKKRVESIITVRDVPQAVYFAYLSEYVSILKEVNGVLMAQYENAKVEEAREALTFQTIDKAIFHKKKYSFGLTIKFLISFLSALFLSTMIVVALKYVDRERSQRA